MTDLFKINSRKIGPGQPVYIIAEMSANHCQNFEKAIAIVRAAKDAGADAIKLQTYTPDTMTLKCDSKVFSIKGTIWDGRMLHDLYGEAYTPWEWHADLKKIAEDIGLDFFSTPFDFSSVDFLEGLGVPAYKVASFEIVDVPLLKRIAMTGKPVIMSTGMASFEEIEEAVVALRDAGCIELALLKCTSAYPAPPEEMNLLTIPHLAASFGVPAGLSDHTLGITSSIVAVSLGACIIEKHFCISRSEGGPDSSFSLEPQEFTEMVRSVREAETALGVISYVLTEKEKDSVVFRRSLFVVEDLMTGEIFTERNIKSIRPATGLHPRHYEDFLGKTAAHDIPAGTPLSWDMISGGKK